MPETARGAASETIAAALRRASGELRSAGIEGAGNDARRLLAWVLGLSGAQLLSRSELTLSPEQSVAFDRCIARRRGREPVARIIGAREFYGRSFAISPATLDPRPDSETLIETALEIVEREGRHAKALRILDVGTGTRLPAADAPCRAAERHRRRHRHQQGRSRCRPRECAAPRRRRSRRVAGERCAGGRRRPVRYPGQQSALRPLRRHCPAGPGGQPLRSVSGARRRQRRFTLFLPPSSKSCSGRAGRLDRARGRLRSGGRSCRPARHGHPCAEARHHRDQAGCDRYATLCGC